MNGLYCIFKLDNIESRVLVKYSSLPLFTDKETQGAAWEQSGMGISAERCCWWNLLWGERWGQYPSLSNSSVCLLHGHVDAFTHGQKHSLNFFNMCSMLPWLRCWMSKTCEEVASVHTISTQSISTTSCMLNI